MGKFLIDGKEIEFKTGDTILRAALRGGINIPYFCWHPKLSVVASCRICLVKVEGLQKLVPACHTEAKEGMIVYSSGAEIEEHRRAIMEFLLLHHPIDCPICDQSGECKLQDYYWEYDLRKSRFPYLEEKLRKEKRKVWGPFVIYDAERCILCTRCVRFSNEIVGKPILTPVERGDKTYIEVAHGYLYDHDYSIMTTYLCPTGALTNRDFRFKVRVWFLNKTPTICLGCSSLCDIYIEHKDSIPFRVQPLDETTFVCDKGFLIYKKARENRALKPILLGEEKEDSRNLLLMAIQKIKRNLKFGVVFNAGRSIEENLSLLYFSKEILNNTKYYIIEHGEWEEDGISSSKYLSPNKFGLELLLEVKERVTSFSNLLDDFKKGEVEFVFMLKDEFSNIEIKDRALLSELLVFTPILDELSLNATVSLPIPSFLEVDGTFITKKEGKYVLKKQNKACMLPSSQIKPVWDWLNLLSESLGVRLTKNNYMELANSARMLLK